MIVEFVIGIPWCSENPWLQFENVDLICE